MTKNKKTKVPSELIFKMVNDESGDYYELKSLLQLEGEAADAANALSASTSDENLRSFFSHICPPGDSNPPKKKSATYELIWENFSRSAYDEKGWYCVVANLQKIKINSKDVILTDDQNEYILQEFTLQLVRDDQYMYRCN